MVLVERFGLVGVALGTLIPIVAATLFILYPAACRRVELPIRHAAQRAIVPALWPAVPAALVMWLTRDVFGASRLAVAAEASLGVLVYMSIFIAFAVGRADRTLYLNRIRSLVRRRDISLGPERATAPGALAGGR